MIWVSFFSSAVMHSGCSAIKEMLPIHRQPNDVSYISYVVELLTVVLTNNYFDGAYYNQVSDTSMGTKWTPYANLFMNRFKEQHVYTHPLQPNLLKGVIDDIFLIGQHVF